MNMIIKYVVEGLDENYEMVQVPVLAKSKADAVQTAKASRLMKSVGRCYATGVAAPEGHLAKRQQPRKATFAENVKELLIGFAGGSLGVAAVFGIVAIGRILLG